MHIKWIHTSDIHGALTDKEGLCSIHSVAEYVRSLDEDVILTDGGDSLMGSPYTHYYNNIATEGIHGVARVMNTMHYDAAVIGNHDIEAGKDVYERFVRDCEHPVLCANSEAFQPYTIIEKKGIRIAVIGITTSAVSHWLHPSLWESLKLKDAFQSARYWVERVKEEEKPDFTVGLFHSGWNGGVEGENVTERIAKEVEGFDLILYGHDHHSAVHKEGEVVCVNPGSHAMSLAEVDIEIDEDGRKEVKARIVKTEPTLRFVAMRQETKERKKEAAGRLTPMEEWLNEPVGRLKVALDEREAYFGSSLFIDLFHKVQMEVVKADISFFSPVSFDTRIDEGLLTMNDMFRLYRFETTLYEMRLKGQEIKGMLEMSYGLWTNQMTSSDDEALLLEYNLDGGTRKGLKNISLNMLSACGITYTVDLSKPIGNRVNILCFDDGRTFSLDTFYTIVINSYHGNGGGDLLTKGAGIPYSELPARIISISPKGLRDYLIDYVKREGVVAPNIISHWKFIPEEWTEGALLRERKLLFQ